MSGTSRLRVRDDARSTAILGYSFGGLAAVRAQQRAPDRFGRVVAMSPSLWVGEGEVIAHARQAEAPLRAWIDVGMLEGRRGEQVPYMVQDARLLRDVLVVRGMRFGRDLGYLEQPNEEHSFDAAGRRMRSALAFALGDIDLADRRPEQVSVVPFRPPVRARWQTFAVQARYEEPFRLTWPASAVELRTDGGDREISGALVRPLDGARLVARVRGVESR